MWVKGTGILVYNPKRPGIRKLQRQSPWWVIVQMDNDIARYYRWWVWRRFGLILQQPTWGTHITLVNDKDVIEPAYKAAWRKHNGQRIEFEYSVDIEQHWKFWVLPARSIKFEAIRAELGIFHKHPFHITVGRME